MGVIVLYDKIKPQKKTSIIALNNKTFGHWQNIFGLHFFVGKKKEIWSTNL